MILLDLTPAFSTIDNGILPDCSSWDNDISSSSYKAWSSISKELLKIRDIPLKALLSFIQFITEDFSPIEEHWAGSSGVPEDSHFLLAYYGPWFQSSGSIWSHPFVHPPIHVGLGWQFLFTPLASFLLPRDFTHSFFLER